jgi:1D-myo-inositol 3-kinase
VNSDLHFDYTTVGHVTVDVLPDGSRRPGGTAFYSALQAARLGRRTLILTRGAQREIEALLEPYRGEFELHIQPAPQTTVLDTRGTGAARTQRVLTWAGAMTQELACDSAILHLAPVARECPLRWRGGHEFVGLTPQGLARGWSSQTGGEVSLLRPAGAAEEIARRCRAIVVSEHERVSCEALIATAGAAGAISAITNGGAPTRILSPDGDVLEVNVPAIEDPGEDLGAGDVFAAAFFIALNEGQAAGDAAAFANAAAAVRMQGTGANAIGDLHAIAGRLQTLSG